MKRKKIGILTFHCTPNYGAILQAYALKTYLQRQNLDVFLIDYQCKGNSQYEFSVKGQTISASAIKSVVKRIIFALTAEKAYKEKMFLFSEFRKKHFSIVPIDEIINLDSIVCGSDQIWNANITGGLNDVYFCNDDCFKSKYCFSYAASVGSIDEIKDIETFQKRMDNFQSIGVREKSLYDFLLSKNVNCCCNIDPTFLLSEKDYITELDLHVQKSSPFLLVYELVKNPKLDEVATIIADRKNLPIRYISGNNNISFKHDSKVHNAGPKEFLELLYNASFVVTDSFHGVAFSLVFHKQFVSVPPQKRSARIYDLLDELDLLNRIAENGFLSFTANIDYACVNQKIHELARLSKRFLLQNVNKIKYRNN